MLRLRWVRFLSALLTLAHCLTIEALSILNTHNTYTMKPLRQDINDLMRKTLEICLGVQLMRNADVFHVYEGVDFGILWPLQKAGKYAQTPEIRQWVLDFLNSWPRESVMVSS